MQLHNLEEELVAMLAPNAPVTEEQKSDARAMVLAKVMMLEPSTPIEGNMRELRAALELQSMSMSLFKSSCGHLARGDRDLGRPLIGYQRKSQPATHSDYRPGVYQIWRFTQQA